MKRDHCHWPVGETFKTPNQLDRPSPKSNITSTPSPRPRSPPCICRRIILSRILSMSSLRHFVHPRWRPPHACPRAPSTYKTEEEGFESFRQREHLPYKGHLCYCGLILPKAMSLQSQLVLHQLLTLMSCTQIPSSTSKHFSTYCG